MVGGPSHAGPQPRETLDATVEVCLAYSEAMASYVLSVLGTDRAGLVEALSGVIEEHGGNWERSHMTQLAGKFAGVLLVTVPDARASGFVDALAPLDAVGLLDISIEAADESQPAAARSALTFEVVGNDRPGIVHELSHLLASLDANILDLVTRTESAAMDGATLFHARAVVELPPAVEAAELVRRLEALANDLMVDIETETGTQQPVLPR